MNRLRLMQLWSVSVGIMDAITGILLTFLPQQTLALMRVPAVTPEALIFLSWMGVFIGSVGMSYALVFRGSREAETVWIFTAGVRCFVAVFLVWKISSGVLGSAWGLVALTDFSVAFGQAVFLRAGGWKGREK